MNYKIGKIEAILLILIVMMNKILLNIPKEIIKQSKTGAPVNIIYITIISLLITLVICKLLKKFPNEDIIDIAHYIGKKPLQIIIGILFIALFSLTILTAIYKFTDLLKMLYFPSTPVLLIFISFIVCMGFANKIGFRGIVRANAIITILLLISLTAIVYGTFKDYNINRIYPVFGQNIKNTFINGTLNIFAFGGLLYLMFIKPFLKHKNDFKIVALASILISGLFLLLSATTLLMLFPFITQSEEIMSMYLLVRNIVYGEFFQRIDALFIFLWLIAAFSYLSISLMFLTSIFKKLTNSKEANSIQYSFLGILLGAILLSHNQAFFTFLEVTIYKYLVLSLLAISLIILIIANLKRKGHI